MVLPVYEEDRPTLVILESAEWSAADKARGCRSEIVYYFLTHGKSKPRDPAWMLRPDDQIFLKNTTFKNNHPVYQSAKNRMGTNPWFDFDADETEINGTHGLLLTCKSMKPMKAKAKVKVKKPVRERTVYTREQWEHLMNFAKGIY